MKTIHYAWFMQRAALLWLGVWCGIGISSAQAQSASASSSSMTTAVSESSTSTSSATASSMEASDDGFVGGWDVERNRKAWRYRGHRNELVGIGHDVTLAAGEQADSVVAIMGSATSDGEVRQDVVSVLGSTRVTGPVGHDVVAVLGNVYVNSNVGHDVVAVMGNVQLGPQAVIDHQLVAVGGKVSRDPSAVVRGGVQGVSLGDKVGFDWLQPWIKNCLLYGRPLALVPGLGWAWTLALLSLLFYVLTAMMAPRAVDRCVSTLETAPGYSLLTALLAALATPILFVLLFVTVIGIVAIPFLGIGLLSLAFFGKLVMLAWLGRRVTRSMANGNLQHAAIATLIGGAIVTALYLVPVLGFVVYKLLGFVGYGVVVYTLILAFKGQRAQPQAASKNTEPPPEAQTFSERGNEGDADDASMADAGDSGATTATSRETIKDSIALPRASFWLRMGALSVDLVLVAFILNLVFRVDDILLLTAAVYGALMWKLKGTTIGGILFNLHVVRLDGRELDWPTVIVRALSCFLSLIVLGLGFIWIAIDPERQAWHDKIAGTVVVRTPKGVSLV